MIYLRYLARPGLRPGRLPPREGAVGPGSPVFPPLLIMYKKKLQAALVACKDVIMQSTAVTPAEVPPGRCFFILFDDLPFTPVYVHSKPDSGVAGVQVRWVKQGERYARVVQY